MQRNTWAIHTTIIPLDESYICHFRSSILPYILREHFQTSIPFDFSSSNPELGHLNTFHNADYKTTDKMSAPQSTGSKFKSFMKGVVARKKKAPTDPEVGEGVPGQEAPHQQAGEAALGGQQQGIVKPGQTIQPQSGTVMLEQPVQYHAHKLPEIGGGVKDKGM